MGKILHLQRFIEPTLPKQTPPMNGDLRGGDDLASAILELLIRQMCREQNIVPAYGTPEELGHRVGNAQSKAREDARIVLEQAIGARAWTDVMKKATEIPRGIEYGKQIVVLKRMERISVEKLPAPQAPTALAATSSAGRLGLCSGDASGKGNLKPWLGPPAVAGLQFAKRNADGNFRTNRPGTPASLSHHRPCRAHSDTPSHSFAP